MAPLAISHIAVKLGEVLDHAIWRFQPGRPCRKTSPTSTGGDARSVRPYVDGIHPDQGASRCIAFLKSAFGQASGTRPVTACNASMPLMPFLRAP